MSTRAFARLDANLDVLIAEMEEALRQCRRRSRAQSDLIGDRIPDFTDPDWVVSVPGSGHGRPGMIDPNTGTGGGFDDGHPLNPRGED